MKKIITLVLIATLAIAGGLMVFADDAVEKECLLTEEQIILVTEVKTAFLNEKVADGIITQTEADEMLVELAAREGRDTLRTLGFGQWLRSSEYFDSLEDIMPHKNMESKGNGQGNGNRRGNRDGNRDHSGTCDNE